MQVSSPEILRSLTSEAGRQSEFYHRRADQNLTEFWADLEALAFQAKSNRSMLIIETRDLRSLPIPIKVCQQHEQL